MTKEQQDTANIAHFLSDEVSVNGHSMGIKSDAVAMAGQILFACNLGIKVRPNVYWISVYHKLMRIGSSMSRTEVRKK